MTTTNPTTAAGAKRSTQGRGGKRPGAGAPRGNTNALKHGRRTRLFETMALDPIFRAVPPAARELLTIALSHAIIDTLADLDRQGGYLDDDELERQRIRSSAIAAQQVITAFADAWTGRKPRDQREAALVSTLAPWLRTIDLKALDLSVQSKQSNPESGRTLQSKTIKRRPPTSNPDATQLTAAPASLSPIPTPAATRQDHPR